MLTSKENLQKTLNHEQPEKVVIDFGSTAVTGIHVLAIKNLRSILGLKDIPVKVTEPYQMLGAVDEELGEKLGIDILGLGGRYDMFGIDNAYCEWKPYTTPWGQKVMVPESFNISTDIKGDTYIYPGGDRSVPACAKMPASGYFFDAVIRQKPIDDNNLNPEDNLEEFKIWDKDDINYWRASLERFSDKVMGLIVTPGGTAIGDIALVPGLQLKDPRGIRDVSEWYMSTLARTDYLHEIFSKQTDIAIENLKKLRDLDENLIDVLFICGTDFGTQVSTFIAEEQYRELYMPYYLKINNWIHENTSWKTFKHSCGAIEPFIPVFIESGFDILNPVQLNATGMDPVMLKKNYGSDIVFWGGGIDTQKVLSFSDPETVRKEVLRNCEIFHKDGGFVFNTVHNIQANVPVRNLDAMIRALKEFNGQI